MELTDIDNAHDFVTRHSHPFCYGCYKRVHSTIDDDGIEHAVCPTCGSDDLMRIVDGVGVEYGDEWVLEHFVKESIEKVDSDELYTECLKECYVETIIICGQEYDTIDTFKNIDPIAYRCGLLDYESALISEGDYIEIDNNLYRVADIENYLET